MKPPATRRPTLHLQAEVTFEFGQRRGKLVAQDQMLSVEVPTVTTGLALCRLVLSRVNSETLYRFLDIVGVDFKLRVRNRTLLELDRPATSGGPRVRTRRTRVRPFQAALAIVGL